MRQTVFDFIKKKYKISPEYPWQKYDSSRHVRTKMQAGSAGGRTC